MHGGVVVHHLRQRRLEREHLRLQVAETVAGVVPVDELRRHALAVIQARLLARVLAHPLQRPHAGGVVVEVGEAGQRHDPLRAARGRARDRRRRRDAAAVGPPEVDRPEVGGVGAAALHFRAHAVGAAHRRERAVVGEEAEHVEDRRPPRRPPLVQAEVAVVLEAHVLDRAGGDGGELDGGERRASGRGEHREAAVGVRGVGAGGPGEAEVVVALRRLGVDVGAEAVVGDGEVEAARGPVFGGGVGGEARALAQRLADEERVGGVIERLPDRAVAAVEHHEVAVAVDADAGDGPPRAARRPDDGAVGRLEDDVARGGELGGGALPDGAGAVGGPDDLRDAGDDGGHERAAVAVDDGDGEEEVGAGSGGLVVGAEEAEGVGGAEAGGVEAQQRGAGDGAVHEGDVVGEGGVRVGPGRGWPRRRVVERLGLGDLESEPADEEDKRRRRQGQGGGAEEPRVAPQHCRRQEGVCRIGGERRRV
ncbi:hypothetical protein SEVIR_5G465850v4 [Setaria viridis]